MRIDRLALAVALLAGPVAAAPIPSAGILKEADLITIAHMSGKAKDEFTASPANAYAGRVFSFDVPMISQAVELKARKVVTGTWAYDIGTQSLRLRVENDYNGVVLNEVFHDNAGWTGRNAFGSSKRVESSSSRLNYLHRDAREEAVLGTDLSIPPDEARALSTHLIVRLEGEVAVSDGSVNGGTLMTEGMFWRGKVARCYDDTISATYDSPIEVKRKVCAVNIVLTDARFIDGRTDKILYEWKPAGL